MSFFMESRKLLFTRGGSGVGSMLGVGLGGSSQGKDHGGQSDLYSNRV